jgi:hypothetical protein
MELGELRRAIEQSRSVLSPQVRKLERRKDLGNAVSIDEEAHGYLLVFAAKCANDM